MEGVEMEVWQQGMMSSADPPSLEWLMSSAEPPSLERMMSSPERLSSNGMPHSQTLTSFQTVCPAAA